MSSEQDTLATRFFREPIEVDNKRITVDEAQLKESIKEYFSVRGWDK